jgi:pimeloyl-ACP methyl ester carboxylesterase
MLALKLPATLALNFACLLLAQCASAPAGVERVTAPAKLELHALLTEALKPDDEAAGKLALGRFVERWKDENMGATGVLEACGGSRITYRVTFDGESCANQTLAYFDEIRPAADFRIKKLKHHMRAGVGTPLMAVRENRNSEAIETYFPPEAITRALTAVATPGARLGHTQDVRVSLMCPLRNDAVVQNGRSKPLAADFSVPWAVALARTGRLNGTKFLEMMTRTPRRKPQLYLMEPYDPNKEPLIMIHGLASTPLAWSGLSNDIWADDAIRRRYQIWHYLYNTSAPPLYSSRLLRNQLKELRPLLDPEGDDPAMRRTTLLTHSMGGLVGKAMAMEPRDRFWKAAFNVPPERLKLSDEDRAMLNDAFEWKADPTIHRIIFVATPHRGSSVADGFIGRVGTLLTKPASQFQDFYARVSVENPGVFTPEYAALGRGRLDSVDSLSPKQPTLRILAEMPFAHPVSVHSIMGNRGRPGPIEESSDGIVPYSSSHLVDAESELVVPDGHGCYKHPQAVEELKRVLKL